MEKRKSTKAILEALRIEMGHVHITASALAAMYSTGLLPEELGAKLRDAAQRKKGSLR